MNFITTCEDLVAPLPEDAPWAEELRTHCSFIPVGCLVSARAPHVITARSNGQAEMDGLGCLGWLGWREELGGG